MKRTNRIWAATMAALATFTMSLCTGCNILARELLEEVMLVVEEEGGGADEADVIMAELMEG